MTELVLAVLGSGALSAVISGLMTRWNSRKRKNDGVSEGVQVLLYDRIKYLGCRYIADGEISAGDLEDLIRMHNVYHDGLDGNGYLDSVISAVKKLPIR